MLILGIYRLLSKSTYTLSKTKGVLFVFDICVIILSLVIGEFIALTGLISDWVNTSIPL